MYKRTVWWGARNGQCWVNWAYLRWEGFIRWLRTDWYPKDDWRRKITKEKCTVSHKGWIQATQIGRSKLKKEWK